MLEYLCQQFAHLELVNVLPDDLEQRDFVVNRALDVRSASMMYLAVSIRHDATPLGTPGTTPICIRLNDVRQKRHDDCHDLERHQIASPLTFGETLYDR